MALWKRGDWYWTDFTVNGTRYRLPLETKDAREAKGREKDKIADAREGRLAPSNLSFARLGFETAADRYLAEVAVQRPGSVRNTPKNPKHDPDRSWEGDLLRRLRPCFAGKRLNQITADDVRAYQAERVQGGKHPNTVNHEVKALMRLLKRAKLLSRIHDDIKLLPVKREPREMLTQAEKQCLFETAATKDEWQTAYCAALLTANTSMRPVEIKRLRWQDIEPLQRLIIVRRSKTDAGTRVIPLNDEAWAAVAALNKRAEDLGTYSPESYMLPQQWPKLDASKPMGRCGWRRAWRSLTSAVRCPKCQKLQQPTDACRNEECKADMREVKSPFAGRRFYDLRHQCITEMLEAGVPEGVIREVAGHIDPQMTKLYSHPRLAARRAAVEAISVIRPVQAGQNPPQIQGGHVTNHVTKALPVPMQNPQVIEEIGRGARI